MDIDSVTFPDEGIFADLEGLSVHTKQFGYEYERLPPGHIRLLQILPAATSDSANSRISCKLTQCSLTSSLPYTALSYTWGRPSDDCEIFLNGQRMPVRKNLWRFLHEAQKLFSKRSQWFWIDAICINQLDYTERAQQVLQMPQIYSQSRELIIWLGPSFQDSRAALSALRHEARRRRRNEERPRRAAASASLCMLCYRTFWTRLWIYQELTLARNKKIMCGDQIVAYEDIRMLVLDIAISQQKLDLIRPLIQDSPAFSLFQSIHEQKETRSLFELILSTQRFHCLEPRDRVYALLGVATHVLEDIKPDYRTNLSVLLNAVLKNHHERVTPPDSIDIVQDQCHKLINIFGESSEDTDLVFQLAAQEQSSRYDKNLLPIGRQGSCVTLPWCLHYGHEAVQSLILSDAGISLADWLYAAAEDGNDSTIKFLLDRGVKTGARPIHSPNGFLALYAASVSGHTETVRLLLSRTSVEYPYPSTSEHEDIAGRGDQMNHSDLLCSISYAIDEGHADIVKLLIGSDAWAVLSRYKYHDMRDLLARAAELGHLDVVQALVDHGVKVTGSVYRSAARHGRHNVIQFLSDRGIKGGNLALVHAAMNGATETVMTLLDSVSGLTNSDLSNALEVAMTAQDVSLATLLLDRGAKISQAWNWYVEHLEKGHNDMAKLLLERSIKADKRQVLSDAIRRGEIGVVKGLLDYFATANLDEALCPIAYCSRSTQWSVASVQDEPICRPFIMDGVAHRDRFQYEKLLIARGANLECLSMTRLAAHGQFRLLRLLVNKGGQADAMTICYAIHQSDHKLLEDLLCITSGLDDRLDLRECVFSEHDCDEEIGACCTHVKMHTCYSNVLYEAVQCSDLEVVKLLLKHGAEVLLASKTWKRHSGGSLRSRTALECAERSGKSDILSLLEEKLRSKRRKYFH